MAIVDVELRPTENYITNDDDEGDALYLSHRSIPRTSFLRLFPCGTMFDVRSSIFFSQ